MGLIEEKIDKAVERIKLLDGFENVCFIIQYGSSVSGMMNEDSDIDLAIYYDVKENNELSRYRFKVLSTLFDDIYDIHIFQQLPLYVRMEILKGNVIYCRDRNLLYEIARQTIKEFDGFKYRYYDYIGEGCIA